MTHPLPRPTSCLTPCPTPGASAGPARRWRTGAALTLLSSLMVACGGGGGGDSGPVAATPAPITPPVAAPVTPPVTTPAPAGPTAVFIATDASAAALVREAEQRTRDMRLASGLAGAVAPVVSGSAVPGGSAGIGLATLLASQRRAQAQAVQSLTSELCSSGSASVDVDDALLARFADAKATLVTGDTLAFSASQCTVKAAVELGADAALGNFGIGSVIDGRFTLVVEQRNATDQVLKLTYSRFNWAPVGEVAFGALDAVIRFGQQGGQAVFALELPNLSFLSTPQVSASGTRISVASGSVRTPLAAAAGSGQADLSYSNWVYALDTGRASAGTATLTGAGSAVATVTAGATAYTVDITANGGGTQRFSVPR